MEKATAMDNFGCTVTKGANTEEAATVIGYYTAQCFDADGNLKWEENFPNAVTQEGKVWLLEQLQTGQATVNSKMFLFYGGTAANTASYATPLYTECPGAMITAGRQTVNWSAAAGGSAVATKTVSSASVFTIASSNAATIYGAGVVLVNAAIGNLATPADTALAGGKCYSVGTFASGKAVSAGDVLNVTYTTSLS